MNRVEGHEITRRVKLRMVASGVQSATALHRLTGLNRSTLSLKMSGARRWNIEDLQEIAATLGTTVAYLITETDDPEPLPGQAATDVAAPKDELTRRLTFLGTDPEPVITEAMGRTQPLPKEQACCAKPDTAGHVYVSRQVLESVAVEHDVPIAYLTTYEQPEQTDHLEALIEFGRAARTLGIERAGLRSIDTLTADELRLMAQAINRSMPISGSCDASVGF